MRGFSGRHRGPEDAMAPEKSSDAMMRIQASPDAEITGGQSPAYSSVRLLDKVWPLNKRQSRMDQFVCLPSQHELAGVVGMGAGVGALSSSFHLSRCKRSRYTRLKISAYVGLFLHTNDTTFLMSTCNLAFKNGQQNH
eukprot:351323-Chlamydomonas_euryale.AAC.20